MDQRIKESMSESEDVIKKTFGTDIGSCNIVVSSTDSNSISQVVDNEFGSKKTPYIIL